MLPLLWLFTRTGCPLPPGRVHLSFDETIGRLRTLPAAIETASCLYPRFEFTRKSGEAAVIDVRSLVMSEPGKGGGDAKHRLIYMHPGHEDFRARTLAHEIGHHARGDNCLGSKRTESSAGRGDQPDALQDFLRMLSNSALDLRVDLPQFVSLYTTCRRVRELSRIR